MINFNNHLFATYEVHDKYIEIICDKDENGNSLPTDIMHLFAKNKLTYLYNVFITCFTSKNDGKIIINGIEMEGNSGSGAYSLENMLVKSFVVTGDCNFYISYCL